MKFTDLGLAEPLLRAVAAEGYTVPTPIQIKAIPHVLEGRDLLGCAQTGTGKTAAFALPMLQLMSNVSRQAVAGPQPPHHSNGKFPHARTDSHHPKAAHHIRALILCPTRELASQIGESFRVYGRNVHLKHTVVFGGVSQHHQVKALKSGVDILIATPGRLLDLMNQGFIDLRAIEIFVLDEADRMLDMGFIPDIRKIVQRIPAKRQTLLFSATMPADIRKLADSILHQPVSVQVNPAASTVETVAQSVYFVPRSSKPALLTHLLKNNGTHRTLVFTRTKHGADKVVKVLLRAGISAQAIHGNKSQNNRTRALDAFKSEKPPVLVATDIASRGIDVDGITHVINFDMPHEPETYVHRIGRTARAGASGLAISFCDPGEERGHLKDIERLTRVTLEVNRNVEGLASQSTIEPARQGNDRGAHSTHTAKGHGQGRSNVSSNSLAKHGGSKDNPSRQSGWKSSPPRSGKPQRPPVKHPLRRNTSNARPAQPPSRRRASGW